MSGPSRDLSYTARGGGTWTGPQVRERGARGREGRGGASERGSGVRCLSRTATGSTCRRVASAGSAAPECEGRCGAREGEGDGESEGCGRFDGCGACGGCSCGARTAAPRRGAAAKSWEGEAPESRACEWCGAHRGALASSERADPAPPVRAGAAVADGDGSVRSGRSTGRAGEASAGWLGGEVASRAAVGEAALWRGVGVGSAAALRVAKGPFFGEGGSTPGEGGSTPGEGGAAPPGKAGEGGVWLPAPPPSAGELGGRLPAGDQVGWRGGALPQAALGRGVEAEAEAVAAATASGRAKPGMAAGNVAAPGASPGTAPAS